MGVVEMKVPVIGESVKEVTLSQWLKEDGEFVERDEPICEFESDKATLEFPAEASGILKYIASEGDDLEIGALVATIDTSAEGPSGSEKKEEKAEEKQESKESSDTEKTEETPKVTDADEPVTEKRNNAKKEGVAGHPSPAAGKIMRENDLSSEEVDGTGKGGRITKEDANKAVEKSATTKITESKPAEKSVPNEAPKKPVGERGTERKKMSRMRRTIAKRLVSAKNNTAMLTTFNEVDLTEIMALRKKYQESFVEKYGIKLGFMSLFSKACATVLMEMPDVNAQFDEDSLIYHDFVDISIAISTPNGLVVPPVKNVETLDFHEIEEEIKQLAVKARDGSLTLEEMQGGTFTITNGGIFGSMMSTPILNEPQSAILGMHTIQQRPMAINGEVKIRPMMYLALSYDHRVIDGSTSVTFLVKVKQLLEDPIKLFLGI